jgi:hypothetical protein
MINSMNVDPLPQTAAREPVLVRHADKNERNQIMKTIAYTGHFYTTPDLVRPPGTEIEEGNLLATNSSLVTGLDSINFLLDPRTAAREPVLVRHADNNERNAYTGSFYTTPDLVRPPGAEIEEGNLLATKSSLVTGLDSTNSLLDPLTAAREPVLARRGSNGKDIETQTIITLSRPTGTAPSTGGLASAGSANAAQPPSWTALFTQSMSVLSGSGEVSTDKDLDLIAHVETTVPDRAVNREKLSTTARQTSAAHSTSGLASTGGTNPAQTPSWTALFTQSMSVLSGSGDISVDKDLTALVVLRGSPPGLVDTGNDYNPDQQRGSAMGLSSGLRTSTPPCATLRAPSTMRPLLSDAGLDLDFLQINCGKRISAMALLETNVKNKIALI